MRLAFLLAVLFAAALLGLLERYWRPLAWWLGKGHRLLRPALSLLSLGIFAKIAREVHEEETSALDRLSRVYLGVHWFTDVLAGFAAGLFVLIAGTNVLRAADRTAVASRNRAGALP